MDGKQFDSFTRAFQSRLARRSLLKSWAGVAVAALGIAQRTGTIAAQDATPESSTESEPSYLFVQLAESGTWAPKPDADGVYLLTLSAPSAQTLYFSDRPARIFGTVPTGEFLDALGFTPAEPPNAAVVVQTPAGTRDVLVVELFDPIYSRMMGADGRDTLTYQARVLEAYEGTGLAAWVPQADDDQLPQEFSEISLFIDDCPDITSCYLSGIGGPHSYVGPIPGGPYGRCYRFPVCRPCGDYTPCRFNDMCNDAYPQRCQGNCVVSNGDLNVC